MATQQDVRRIALSLPDVTESADEFRFLVSGRQFIWLWRQRIDPKKARIPNPDVIAVRVASDVDKQVLLAMDREVIFTEPHYDGYNAVLVRLKKIRVPMLRDLIVQGHEAVASKTRHLSAAGRARRRSRTDPRRGPASRRAR